MNQRNALKHANHNYEACQYLRESKKFNDWVVTTAFYSAIHYIQHELFPNQYENPRTGKIQQFHRFDDYYSCAKPDPKYSKHKVLQDMVEEFMPEIVNEFQTLKDNCWNARYVDYKFNEQITAICFGCMQTIKNLCSNN